MTPAEQIKDALRAADFELNNHDHALRWHREHPEGSAEDCAICLIATARTLLDGLVLLPAEDADLIDDALDDARRPALSPVPVARLVDEALDRLRRARGERRAQ